MDILRCYKILELNHNASMDEAREAYIDMARVWHPDRFMENPRLRKKVEEKLKEINIAYAEIRDRLSTEPSPIKTAEETPWSQKALGVVSGIILAAKMIVRDFCSHVSRIPRETDLKQILRNVLYPKVEPGGIMNRKSQSDGSISRRTGRMDRDREKHKKFSEIYEEVAKGKEQERKKMS